MKPRHKTYLTATNVLLKKRTINLRFVLHLVFTRECMYAHHNNIYLRFLNMYIGMTLMTEK